MSPWAWAPERADLTEQPFGTLLLLRDKEVRDVAAARARAHLGAIATAHRHPRALRTLQAEKLADALAAARRCELYGGLPQLENCLPSNRRSSDPDFLFGEVLPTLPLLDKQELGEDGNRQSAFARTPSEFLHYFESSGTTSEPAAAPKAVDDLIVNTMNIGEMWARFLGPGDVALILIIAPLAPAPYQFERIMEYLGVMSFRPWVEYIDGDYGKVLRLVDELGAGVFIGAPSRLLAMIQFALRHGFAPPQFDRLLLIAEQTGPSFLRHLERLTGAVAFVGSYGSSETGTISACCEHGRLHLQLQSYLLELHDEHGTRVVDGSSDQGELVVTTLDLPGRPLLRYRTGDLIEVDSQPCPCGIALPVMRTLGRKRDVLAMPGGAVSQEQLEAALWTTNEDGLRVLNYMLAILGDEIVVLVTTEGPVEEASIRAVVARLETLFPARRITLRPVEVLSPIASLSGDLGWKLSRIIDLDTEQMWNRLPTDLAVVLRQTLSELRAHV